MNRLLTARGPGYLVAWLHRAAGLALLLYALLHVNTLATLTNPEVFSRRTVLFSGPAGHLLEWLLAVPLIFHGLNGGRVLIYELFTTRYDRVLLLLAAAAGSLYLAVLAYAMSRGALIVAAGPYWTVVAGLALIPAAAVFLRLGKSSASPFWKLQRLSAALLFTLAPAHMLFMHLGSQLGRDPQLIVQRLHRPLLAALDVALLALVFYHGGHGLLTIGRDYLAEGAATKVAATAALIVLTAIAVQGVLLFWSV